MLVFVDESGDPGMKGKAGSSAYFIISAVIFEENDAAEDCDAQIEALREQLFKGAHREFHFNKLSDRFREDFFRTIAPHDFFHISFALNKAKLYGPGFQYKDSFYKYTANLLFENAKPYLRDASVVIDRSGNREFRQQLEKYLKRKINTDGQIIRKVKSEPSHSNNLIQMADMVCGAIGRSFKEGTVEDRVRFRKMIGHRELDVQLWPKL
jgi:hypothetical protein